jgi:hypothetical protein
MTPGRTARNHCAITLAIAIGIQVTDAAALAAAPTKEVCVTAYESAQDLRRTGKLVAARAELITCSQSSCPSAATIDCVQWLREVEQSLPSVVVSARDASGREVPSLRVLVDGNPLADAQSGRAVPVDPGAHTFRFESSVGPPVDERVTILEGQKSRAVSVILGAKPGADAPASTSTAPAPERPVGAIVWILGGVGVAGLAVFGGVGASSLADESALRDTCAPRCAEEDVSAIRHKHTAADLGLGVGVASLGVATWLFFTRPTTSPPKHSSGAGLKLSFTGTAATLGGTF